MSKDTAQKAQEIVKQEKEIRELENFLFTLDTCKRANTRQSNILAIIKTKTTKEFSIFASRWFGWDTHKSEIAVPDSIVEDLEMVLHEKLENLKADYERIKISHE